MPDVPPKPFPPLRLSKSSEILLNININIGYIHIYICFLFPEKRMKRIADFSNCINIRKTGCL